MKHVAITILLALLAACSTSGRDLARADSTSSDTAIVTYYDRNDDGIVDLEIHQPDHCDDCDWALVDTDFSGRYEKRVRWSFGIAKKAIDMPVPHNVPLTTGQPPLSGWED